MSVSNEEIRRVAVDALYAARGRGEMMDGAAAAVVEAIAPLIEARATDHDHEHIDHHFAVVASEPGEPDGSGEHAFSWFTEEQIFSFSPLVMFPDFRLLALRLFADNWMWRGDST